MQTIWRAAIKANIFLLPHIHCMGLWKQIHLHNKGVQTFISILHAHLRFKKVLYSVNPPAPLTKLQSQRKKNDVLQNREYCLYRQKNIAKGGGKQFFILFLVERENGSFIQSDNHFQITRIKVSHFQSSLFAQMLYFIFNFEFSKSFFFVYYCYYYHVYTSTLPQFQTKLFHFQQQFFFANVIQLQLQPNKN